MFDPNMTYWQSLKIIARGLIQWPLREDDLDDLYDSARKTYWCFVRGILRLTLLLTLPISAPIIALFVHLYRKKITREGE
jgi:hypothetical protein